MALPDIRFNNATGSDGTCSGAGPADPVFGLIGATTNGIASTTIELTQLDGGDIATVASDGSAVLFLNTGSGRRFSKIVSVDTVTPAVTVEDTFTIAVGGVAWAIGGKRLSLDDTGSRTIFDGTNGAKAGWTVTIENTGVPYLANSTITCSASGDVTNGPLTIRGDIGRTEIKWNNVAQTGRVWSNTGSLVAYKNLIFNRYRNAGDFFGVVFGFDAFGNNCVADNCRFEASGSSIRNNFSTVECSGNYSYRLHFRNCEFTGMGSGISRTSGGTGAVFTFLNCRFDSNVTGAAFWNGTAIFNDCIFSNNTGAGLSFDCGGGSTVVGVNSCTFHNNGTAGLLLTNGGSGGIDAGTYVTNSLFTKNGTYGINHSDTEHMTHRLQEDFNCFGTGSNANTSGAVNGITMGPNSFSADPQYVSAGLGNFTPTNAAVKGKGSPGSLPIGGTGGYTYSYPDVGAAQAQEATLPSDAEIAAAIWSYGNRTLTE